MTTNKTPNYKSYIDLLKVETFVQWRIAPSEEIAHYWENWADDNPHLKIEIIKADNHLRKLLSDNNHFTHNDRAELFNNITASVSKKEKKQTLLFKLLPYVAAASVILFIAGGLFLPYFNKKQAGESTTLVEGSTQIPEDIQLITGNTVSTFGQDIEIKVNNGMALIDEGSQNEKRIDIQDNTTINKLIVPYGKRSKIQLSDGSVVWLNSGSTLEFPSKFAKGSRNIKLHGEMYIEVAPDKNNPLFVHTPKFTVEALGTTFNVSAYHASDLSAVLVEGRINVRTKNSKKEVMPHQVATIDSKGNIVTKQTNIESYTSWRNGYLLFNDTPITQVLAQIERYYNLKFTQSENTLLESITCTGKLYLSENLDHIMRSLSLLTGTVYTRKDNTIIITNEPK